MVDIPGCSVRAISEPAVGASSVASIANTATLVPVAAAEPAVAAGNLAPAGIAVVSVDNSAGSSPGELRPAAGPMAVVCHWAAA